MRPLSTFSTGCTQAVFSTGGTFLQLLTSHISPSNSSTGSSVKRLTHAEILFRSEKQELLSPLIQKKQADKRRDEQKGLLILGIKPWGGGYAYSNYRSASVRFLHSHKKHKPSFACGKNAYRNGGIECALTSGVYRVMVYPYSCYNLLKTVRRPTSRI